MYFLLSVSGNKNTWTMKYQNILFGIYDQSHGYAENVKFTSFVNDHKFKCCLKKDF